MAISLWAVASEFLDPHVEASLQKRKIHQLKTGQHLSDANPIIVPINSI